MRRISGCLLFIFMLAALGAGSLAAQEKSQAPAQPQTQSAEQKAQQPPANPNEAANAILEGASERAAHTSETWGKTLGLGPDASFAVSLVLNFAGIVVVFYALLRGKLPQMFRERTNTIQKALKEARAASAEASRRLSDIETRLAKIDAEVNAIKAEAEREADAEEERIKVAAEDDKRKVVNAAEAEISAIARSARHDLKSFAASLAVDLAAQRIKVDDNTDQALMREFVGQLGKDGQ